MIDLQRKWVIPGFIDTHAHIGSTTWGQAASFGIDGLAHFGIYGTPWEIAPEALWEKIRQAGDQ